MQDFKAGKPQWHNLRKDPNDLPKDKDYYRIHTDLGNDYEAKFMGTYWICRTNGFVDKGNVIAWAELPKWEE